MKKVALGGTDADEESRVSQGLSSALGTDVLAINYFECPPGEPIGFCYHRHHEQEEVFYVVSGTATSKRRMGMCPSQKEN